MLFKTVVTLPIAITFIGLVFRSTLYWSFSVAQGEPYGSGDIIEMLLALLLILSSFLGLIYTLILLLVPKYRHYFRALKLAVICISSPICYYFLHALMPKLM